MTPIFLILLCAFFLVVAMTRLWQVQRLKDELRDMTDDRDIKAYRAANAERELAAAKDEIDSRKYVHEVMWNRAKLAEADADRLAPFVQNFIADMDHLAKKLGTIDEKPLDLTEEREAIRLHEEAVKSRTQ